jgi:hypothetical protein
MLIGRRQCPGQGTGSVLGRFAARPGRARLAFRAFVDARIPQAPRPESRRVGDSPRPPARPRALRGGRAGARVLGCSAFVEALVSRVCAAVRLAPTALQESGLFPDDYSATKLSSRGDQHSRCGASIAVSLLDDLVCPVLPFYADSVSI